MKIAVFGASGRTGGLVVQKALAAGHEVTAIARNPATVTEKHAKLRVVQGDTASAGDVENALAGQDAVIVAIGPKQMKKVTLFSTASRNVVAAMRKHGVKRLVYLSATGVGESADQTRRSSFVFGRIIMPLMLKDIYGDHAKAEQKYRTSGLDCVIVRPVGLTDKPETGRVQATADLSQKLGGSWIPRADVADFLVKQVSGSEYLGKGVAIWAK